MPNECRNRIVVSGDERSMKYFMSKVVERVNEEPFTFEWHVPRSSNSCSKSIFDMFGPQYEVWGTKWDAYYVRIVSRPNFEEKKDMYDFIFVCTTAWSPPENWAKNCSVNCKGVRVENYFSEPGMGFYGKCMYENGERFEYEMNKIREEYDEDGELTKPDKKYELFVSSLDLGE